MSGPPVECSGSEGTALGLVLNELATNALKYGALSTRSGKVEVSWRVEGDHLILEWRESDGHILMTGPATLAWRGEIDLAAARR